MLESFSRTRSPKFIGRVGDHYYLLFGKHAECYLDSIPSGYLKFLLEEVFDGVESGMTDEIYDLLEILEDRGCT